MLTAKPKQPRDFQQRVAESSVTAFVYYQLGFFIVESWNILSVLVPSVVLEVPLGAYCIRRLEPETFRRICMSFDAWVVGFGFSRVLIDLKLMASPWAYSVMAAAAVIDMYLLYIFFAVRKAPSGGSPTARSSWSSSTSTGGPSALRSRKTRSR